MKAMQERIQEEISFCFTYEEGSSCCGAGGRKMRETCVWCPLYRKNEKDNMERSDGDARSKTAGSRDHV